MNPGAVPTLKGLESSIHSRPGVMQNTVPLVRGRLDKPTSLQSVFKGVCVHGYHCRFFKTQTD
jgi:hypothetical protein